MSNPFVPSELAPSAGSALEKLANRINSEATIFPKMDRPVLKEIDIRKTAEEYYDDLKEKSQYADTLSDNVFDYTKLEKVSPEETAKMRDEFDDIKTDLKRQWEDINGIPWPKYEEDVYSSNGNLIRKAGSDYDAHHIQPLCMGGQNVVENITPLNAEVHYDKQGIHSPDSPYTKLDKLIGGIEA